MKKTNFLSMALAAIMTCAGFTACGDDDNNSTNNSQSQQQQENFAKYMTQVETQVKAKKSASKNTKALLLVAFGSTWENAHQSFAELVKSYENDTKFKGYDVYFAFTSAKCINRSRMGETYKKSVDFYAPNFWLEAIGRQQYAEVRVQSLHVIPGEEYLRLRDNYVKDFKNNINADLDDAYLERVKIYVGGPLMDQEEDVATLAQALHGLFRQYVQGGNAMVFMGHGNPATLNYGNGNQRYTQLEEALQKYSPNYYVATVDMEGNLLDDLWGRMQQNSNLKTDGSSTITLHALMCIAGDHAHNDMSGIENASDSWREFFQQQGFKCQYNGNDADASNNCILKGLSDYDAIRNIWKNHTVQAEDMFPAEE